MGNEGKQETGTNQELFSDYLGKFKNANIISIEEGEKLIVIKYLLDGKEEVMFSRPHILLASSLFVSDCFFKNPLGKNTDSHISHKTLY